MSSASPLQADIRRAGWDVRVVPILLQKSAAADRRSAISLRAAGIDLPTLTPSTQLQRYATHRTSAGGGRATSDASRRRF
jgi:hypothetical protein